LAAAGADLAGLPCSGGLLAWFTGGCWVAGRRVARERAIQRGRRAAGGDSYAIRWSRPSANSGTTFTTTTGAPVTFARGQVWVMLAGTPSVITTSC
jgi:hypothetical protein